MRRREFIKSISSTVAAVSLFDRRLSAATPASGYSKPVIDAHVHWYPQSFVDLMVKEGAANGAQIEGPNKNGEFTAKVPGGQWYEPGGSVFRREMVDLPTIFEQMKMRRIDMYALSMTHPMVYWAPSAFGLKLSQVANDETSAVHTKYPDKFVGTIMLPLQDPQLALEELDRAAKLPGMRAVNMGEDVNGKSISDKSFWPVWERCEALGLPLFLHNLNPPDHEHLIGPDFSMMNVLGNPYQVGSAAEALMLSGALDAFPRLEVYLPHAGGTFPWLVWRTERSQQRGEFKSLKNPASSYLQRFYYDLIVFNPKLLRVLIDMVGIERMVCGTDYPQGMAVNQPIETVESIPDISHHECEMILCDNPARLLKL